MLNIDGGGGVLDETTGKPEYFTWQGAEKTYADFQLTVTNPGGHSSEPRADNAIDQLAAALVRIQAHRFTPELSDLTRAYFIRRPRPTSRPRPARRCAPSPPTRPTRPRSPRSAANPAMVGKIGTTCVATMISGGHALNALPQRAEANINCRIFPGHKPADDHGRACRQPRPIRRSSFKDVTEGSVATDASPMRPDFVAAVTKAIGERLSRRAGVPGHVVGRQRQHVVPLSTACRAMARARCSSRTRTTSATA